MAAAIVAFGFGVGMFDTSNSTAIMNSVSQQFLGVASGFLALTRTLGYLIGIATLGSLFSIAATGYSEASKFTNFADLPVNALLHGQRVTFQASTLIMGFGFLIAMFLLARSVFVKSQQASFDSISLN
ncbi:MAG: hypothetical protein AAGF24_09770, partial [Cyanobacteria bacterium P01_H01_bin.121]